MITFDGNQLVNTENKKSIIIGATLSEVMDTVGNLVITQDDEDEDLAYAEISNTTFGILTGTIHFIFQDNVLINLSFVPTIPQLVKEPEGYECCYTETECLNYINNQIKKIAPLVEQLNEDFFYYQLDDRRISVGIDNPIGDVYISQDYLI